MVRVWPLDILTFILIHFSQGRNTRGNCAGATTPAAQHSGTRGTTGRDQITVYFGGYREVGGWLLAKVSDSLLMVTTQEATTPVQQRRWHDTAAQQASPDKTKLMYVLADGAR